MNVAFDTASVLSEGGGGCWKEKELPNGFKRFFLGVVVFFRLAI